MLNSLLDIIPGTGKNAGNYVFDNFGEPFIYALIGFVIVFTGILIIICIIWLIGLLMRKTDNLAFLTKKRKRKKEETPLPVEAESVQNGEIPDEVKAAIVAAIMAYYESNQPKCEFKVKRIKRM